MHSTTCSRIEPLALAALLALGLVPRAAPDAAARSAAGRAASVSLVACRSARQPVRTVPGTAGLVRRVGRGQLFAPVREAMFFSRPGDRCAWHGRGTIRG